jgi:hypothetical protein
MKQYPKEPEPSRVFSHTMSTGTDVIRFDQSGMNEQRVNRNHEPRHTFELEYPVLRDRKREMLWQFYKDMGGQRDSFLFINPVGNKATNWIREGQHANAFFTDKMGWTSGADIDFSIQESPESIWGQDYAILENTATIDSDNFQGIEADDTSPIDLTQLDQQDFKATIRYKIVDYSSDNSTSSERDGGLYLKNHYFEAGNTSNSQDQFVKIADDSTPTGEWREDVVSFQNPDDAQFDRNIVSVGLSNVDANMTVYIDAVHWIQANESTIPVNGTRGIHTVRFNNNLTRDRFEYRLQEMTVELIEVND